MCILYSRIVFVLQQNLRDVVVACAACGDGVRSINSMISLSLGWPSEGELGDRPQALLAVDVGVACDDVGFSCMGARLLTMELAMASSSSRCQSLSFCSMALRLSSLKRL